MIFELKYSPSCIKEVGSQDCFGVSIRFNGEDLDLSADGLCSGDGFHVDSYGCTYLEFNNLMRERWYKGPW